MLLDLRCSPADYISFLFYISLAPFLIMNDGAIHLPSRGGSSFQFQRLATSLAIERGDGIFCVETSEDLLYYTALPFPLYTSQGNLLKLFKMSKYVNGSDWDCFEPIWPELNAFNKRNVAPYAKVYEMVKEDIHAYMNKAIKKRKLVENEDEDESREDAHEDERGKILIHYNEDSNEDLLSNKSEGFFVLLLEFLKPLPAFIDLARL
ncbi:hypothetical protein IEQ34_015208 [Dendrobium chrysotoxum]|uniref:Uncharacterized protein n=1 Tax=Dendrobium chrysotoxum TaxID=161865 RepID=A0AAV7GF98_DENCH|nr:hypothetical protein IEQ34_015208 [Dendrobium chrysotoxum]